MKSDIKVNGKTYPVKFGYGVLVEYETLTGKSSTELASGKVDLKDLFTLFHCALKKGAMKAGKDFDLTLENIIDFADEDPNFIGEMSKMLGDSFAPAKKEGVVYQEAKEQSWDDLQEIAFGKLGMTSEQFWDSTPREFYNRYNGWIDLQNTREHQEWFRTRFQTVLLMNVHLKKKIKESDMPFPWEKNFGKKSLSKADVERIKALAHKRHGKTL